MNRHIDQFSLQMMKNTVRFVIAAMLPSENPRIVDCVVTILDYVDSTEAVPEDAVCAAVLELEDLAHACQQSLIADRLSGFARQVRGNALNSKIA